MNEVATMESCPPIDALDETSFTEMFDLGDAALIQEIVDLFLDDTPNRFDEIADAIEREDGASLFDAAHALKGSTRCVGAMRLGWFGEALERLALARDFQDALRLTEALPAELARARTEMERLVARASLHSEM
jgi:HPt (histidine-containing phosphotransfer) domain-containing protein